MRASVFLARHRGSAAALRQGLSRRILPRCAQSGTPWSPALRAPLSLSRLGTRQTSPMQSRSEQPRRAER